MATQNRLKPINVADFTGGINLRSDAFQLAENEVQLALNMEIDPRGGFFSRKGWDKWNTALIGSPAAPTWNPRLGHAQVFGGVEQVMFSNKASYTGGGASKGSVLASSNGTFATITVGANPLVCSATPHMADFASWGSTVYIACGANESAVKWTGTGSGTLIAASAAANWTADYTAPSGSHVPASELINPHLGFMFVANTKEDGTLFPNRVRWSHPGGTTSAIENWAQLDFIDIQDGGDRITALVSFADHLLICKTDSLWRLDGYDADSWQLSPVSMKIGAQTRQAVAVAENRAYMFSYPHGVFEYTPSNGSLIEVSQQLRPGLRSAGFNGTLAALDNVWLNYVGQRLWANVPFSLSDLPTDAKTSLVLDPTLGENSGSWTAFRAADQMTLGPMVETLQSDKTYGACRATASVVAIEQLEEAVDDLTASEAAAFETYLVTRWFDGGWPTRKKSWKRPDVILKDVDSDQVITVQVSRDYDEGGADRQFLINIPLSADGFVWGSGWLWGDGSVWGGPVAGSRIERGPGLGLARSIRLRFNGPPGQRWGVDAIILKIIMKRFK